MIPDCHTPVVRLIYEGYRGVFLDIKWGCQKYTGRPSILAGESDANGPEVIPTTTL